MISDDEFYELVADVSKVMGETLSPMKVKAAAYSAHVQRLQIAAVEARNEVRVLRERLRLLEADKALLEDIGAVLFKHGYGRPPVA